MTPTYLAKKHNDIPDPTEPARGQYDEDAIRCGARELIIEQQRAEIAALKAENARLLVCVRELEREGLEFTEQENRRQQRELEYQEWLDRHNACEAGWNGRIDNRR